MFPSYITWDVDPIMFSIGDFSIAYYGALWAVAFGVALFIFMKMVHREGLDPRIIDSGFYYVIIGTVVGARLGHCIFYEPTEYFLDPFMADFPWIKLLDIRGGGLASHGAAIGIFASIWLFTRKWKLPFLWMLDRVGIMVAIDGALVRIGNLMNSEVYGGPTDMPWGFIFVRDGQTMPMHPTQIYEAVCYLVIFFLLAHLYWRTKVPNRRGVMFGLFLTLLFTSRLIIETIKLPQVAFEQSMSLNMGQLLSIPFIIGGLALLIWALRRAPQPYANMPLAPKDNGYKAPKK